MEIKTVSARPRWESHLHCPSLHLHGHRHGHLHQVLFNLHCKLFENLQLMWIYQWFDWIFSKGVKRCLEEEKNPPNASVCLHSKAPQPDTTELWRDAWQAIFSYWIAKRSHLLWTCVSQKFPQTFLFVLLFLFLSFGMKVACSAVSWAWSDILKLIWTRAAAISKPRTRLMIACLTAKNFCSA